MDSYIFILLHFSFVSNYVCVPILLFIKIKNAMSVMAQQIQDYSLAYSIDIGLTRSLEHMWNRIQILLLASIHRSCL